MDLKANIQEILRVLGEAAEGLEVTLPERRYYSLGGVVYDSEQVTLSVNSVQTGVVGQIAETQTIGHGCPPIWNATMEIAIVRNMAQANQGRRGTLAPHPDTIMSDADRLARDVDVFDAFTVALVNEDQFGGFTSSIALGETQGGLGAIVMTLNINLYLGEPLP